MNVFIQGKLHKQDQRWRIELPIPHFFVECEKPLQGLRMLEDKLRRHLQDERLECLFRIGEDGDFYLVITRTPKVMAFLTKNVVDTTKLRIEPSPGD